MAAAPGKVLAAILSPAGSLGIHRAWLLYRLFSVPVKAVQVPYSVGLGIGPSSYILGYGVTLSLEHFAGPQPSQVRGGGGVKINQTKKPELQTNKLRCPHQVS